MYIIYLQVLKILVIEIMCHSHWLRDRLQLKWCLHISKHMLRPIIIVITYSSIALISSSLAMDMSGSQKKTVESIS